MFVKLLEVLNSGFVLILPLFNDLLLLDHDSVSSLLTMSVLLFGLQQLVFQLGNFDVAIVVQFVDPVMVNHFKPIQL